MWNWTYQGSLAVILPDVQLVVIVTTKCIDKCMVVFPTQIPSSGWIPFPGLTICQRTPFKLIWGKIYPKWLNLGYLLFLANNLPLLWVWTSSKCYEFIQYIICCQIFISVWKWNVLKCNFFLTGWINERKRNNFSFSQFLINIVVKDWNVNWILAVVIWNTICVFKNLCAHQTLDFTFRKGNWFMGTDNCRTIVNASNDCESIIWSKGP